MSEATPETTEVQPAKKGRAVRVEGMSVNFERITPAIAADWLEHNDANRNLRDARVSAVVRDILDGNFQPTHQGVAFYASGKLADGQHRLRAVVVANKTVVMQVTRGLPEEARPVIDTGTKRTLGDVLHFGGYPNRMVASGIITMHLRYERGMAMGSYNSPLSSMELVSHFEAHQEEFMEAARLASLWKSKILATTQVLGTAWIIFNRLDPDQCAEFFEDILNMTTKGEGDPRLALIRRLQSKAEKHEFIHPALVLSMFVRAWNAWRNGTPMTKIPIDRLKSKKVLEAQ